MFTKHLRYGGKFSVRFIQPHQKKRDSKAFAEKSVMLDKLKNEVPPEHYRLVYFDEAGFAASPPIQYGWGPRGQPHMVEPQNHCRRSVLGR